MKEVTLIDNSCNYVEVFDTVVSMVTEAKGDIYWCKGEDDITISYFSPKEFGDILDRLLTSYETWKNRNR